MRSPGTYGPDEDLEPPDGWCPRHGDYYGDECQGCERQVELFEERQRGEDHDPEEDDYVA